MNNTKNENETKQPAVSRQDTQEKNWEKTLKSLDDRLTAQKFYDKKLEIAKYNLGEILAVTSGSAVVVEQYSEFGHAYLMEILEMFLIRHENFDRAQLAEDLQDHIFRWSTDYDEANRQWREKTFASIGLDTYGEPLEKTADGQTEPEESPLDLPDQGKNRVLPPPVENVPSISDIPHFKPPVANNPTKNNVQVSGANSTAAANHYLNVLSDKLCHVLSSRETPIGTRHAIEDIISAAACEADIHIFEPQIVKTFLPHILKGLKFEYGRGVVHSLDAILAGLPDDQQEGLEQFERRDEERRLDKLSAQISAVMNNPLLPEALRNTIAGEINREDESKQFSPDNVRYNLEQIAQDE